MARSCRTLHPTPYTLHPPSRPASGAIRLTDDIHVRQLVAGGVGVEVAEAAVGTGLFAQNAGRAEHRQRFFHRFPGKTREPGREAVDRLSFRVHLAQRLRERFRWVSHSFAPYPWPGAA